ncbi:hypothetical protein HOR18_gp028 [Staphylococcus phage vB_SscM-1]|uniref:Uncharacterized protein n=2 Tax=Sciuriunavirus SscM1 TaxID=2734053 RepID=A0A1X9I9G9_9CAUD|nr:hypothetical protein HOR18_gp028 [Staphylococcus phage vB_SscM-1]ANT44691.1 hypothetical protein vB_SscM-1_028 [Staphylococcus phage vB_SscM-1]ANT44894.1 hypothetical protein vB_SscM-2_027 [Staphylococcus phage vB_SscM-2]
MDYEHEDFIIDLADGYPEEALEEIEHTPERFIGSRVSKMEGFKVLKTLQEFDEK